MSLWTERCCSTLNQGRHMEGLQTISLATSNESVFLFLCHCIETKSILVLIAHASQRSPIPFISLLLVQRIHEIRSNRNQLILLSPLSNAAPLLSSSPMLSILRLRQVEWLRCPVSWCIYQKHISMFSCLGRRTRWLPFHDLVQPLTLFVHFLQVDKRDGENRIFIL